MKTRMNLGVLLVAFALCAGPAGVAEASDWKWSVSPYLWLTDTGVDIRVADRQVVDTTIPVSDLIEDIDTIVQVRLVAQKGELGAMVDLFDVTMSDAASGVALPDGSGVAAASSEIGMTVLDAAGLWDPKGDQQGFILVYGVRILDQRASIDATISPISGGTIAGRRDTHDTFVDALLGARFNHRFGRHWNVQAQADASTGGTDHTWSAGPSLGYAFGDAGRHSITAGYRHMAVDFADDGEVAPAMTLSGAVLGYRFSF